MPKFNKIEKLISDMCPDGVEYKDMGEVCNFQNGFAFKSNLFKSVGLPVIRITNIHNQYIDDTNCVYFDENDYSENLSQYVVGMDDILIAMSGATTGKIGYVKSNKKLYLNQRVGKFIPNKKILNNSFLFYLLLSKKTDIYILAGGGAQPNLSSAKLMKELKIPIPPLPIQEEIVKILDTFTELEAELETKLEAELEARKKQYKYYRSRLLISEDNVEIKQLEDIAEFTYGFTDKAKDKGNIRFVRITDINENGKLRENDRKFLDLTDSNKKYLLKKGDILMARTGATYGKTMLFNEDYEAVFASFLIRIRFHKNTVIPAYYWHYSQSDLYWEQTKKLVGGGAQPQFNANVLKLISIPVPPLTKQERIVSILDKFDALVNGGDSGSESGMTGSLPAELAARRKQYEYYRNKLLTFKEYVQ